MSVSYYSSPLGSIEIITENDFVKDVTILKENQPEFLADTLAKEVTKQLSAYFDKKLTDFDLPLAPDGTDFQKKIWQLLLTIPYGKTISYQDLARMYGNEKVIRAAGSANGKNPIPIIIPCHRVIGKNGDLVGYSGGLHIKRFLLDLESNELNLF